MVQKATDKLPAAAIEQARAESRSAGAAPLGRDKAKSGERGAATESGASRIGEVVVGIGSGIGSGIKAAYSKEPGRRKLQITATVLVLTTLVGYAFMEWFGLDGRYSFGNIVYSVGLAGLVGFGTNWVAIKMLFHPRRPFFGIQGVFPRKKAQLAKDAARLMEERLISGHHLRTWLEESGAVSRAIGGLVGELPKFTQSANLRPLLLEAGRDFVDQAIPGLSAKLRGVIEQTVRDKVPSFMAGGVVAMVGPLLSDAESKIAAHLKDEATLNGLVDRITPRLREMVTRMMEAPGAGKQMEQAAASAIEQLFAELRVADLLEREIMAQSNDEIERMVNAAASDQLVFLQVAGGVLGCIAGLALVWPVMLLVFLVPIGVLMLLSRFPGRD